MREDYGKYACHASSIKGAAEKTIEISGTPQRGFHYRWVVKSFVGILSPGPIAGSISQMYGSGSGSGSFPCLFKVLSGLK
jgi:hypothetical protein